MTMQISEELESTIEDIYIRRININEEDYKEFRKEILELVGEIRVDFVRSIKNWESWGNNISCIDIHEMK